MNATKQRLGTIPMEIVPLDRLTTTKGLDSMFIYNVVLYEGLILC